jgi:hypothetical protein
MWHHPLMPETLRREFNLPHSGLSSRERGLVLEDAALAWAGRDGQRRLDFDDIALIKMEAEIDGDNPFAQCDIVFRDETRLRVEVTNDANHYDDALEYRAFLAAFFDQLGPERRARIDFIYGPSALKRTIQIAVSAAFTAAFIGLIIFQLFSPDLWRDNNWLLIPLALLMGSLCAGLLYLSIKNRQTPFEPLAIPEMLLPMLIAKRKA